MFKIIFLAVVAYTQEKGFCENKVEKKKGKKKN